MEDNTGNDNRIETRRHLLLYLDIVNLDTNKSFAKLGDINSSGILLLLGTEIQQGSEFSLAIIIPESLDFVKKKFEISASVRWCKKAARPGMYEAGCSIGFKNEDDSLFLQALIDRIGFSDGTKRIFLQNEQNVFNKVQDEEN